MARYSIKNNPACEAIWINEALDEIQRTERAELRGLAASAKEEGLESRVVSDTHIVQGIKYHHTSLNKLPPNLTLN